MNIEEFLKGIKKIENAYNTKFDKDKLNLWYSKLKNMNIQQYLNRIDELITTKQFIPNIAEILNQEPRKQFANYEQRDCETIDFESLYVNKQRS